MPAGEVVGLGLPPGIQVTADEHDRAVRIGEACENSPRRRPPGVRRAIMRRATARRRVGSASPLADLAGLARRLPVVPATDGQPAAP
ncbi:MAG TPA: hypothetical protein VK162_02540 [Streptosporangiaceae bacterium]|nr:hypothetical protein [Streptosporangiaceae bacterium]